MSGQGPASIPRPSGADVVAAQQQLFGAAILIAAVPVILQVVAWFVVISGPEAWPKVDRSILGVRFWMIQAGLVGLALGGNALLDVVKAVMADRQIGKVGVPLLVATPLALLVVSLSLPLSILNQELGYAVLGEMLIASGVCATLAYMIELRLALLEAGLL